MKPVLICHIGLEKTGTTALQSFLYDNAALIEEQGFAYSTAFGRGSQSELAAVCLGPEGDEKLIDRYKLRESGSKSILEARIRAEIASLSQRAAKAVILSSEHLGSRLRSASELKASRAAVRLRFQ